MVPTTLDASDYSVILHSPDCQRDCKRQGQVTLVRHDETIIFLYMSEMINQSEREYEHIKHIKRMFENIHARRGFPSAFQYILVTDILVLGSVAL